MDHAQRTLTALGSLSISGWTAHERALHNQLMPLHREIARFIRTYGMFPAEITVGEALWQSLGQPTEVSGIPVRPANGSVIGFTFPREEKGLTNDSK